MHNPLQRPITRATVAALALVALGAGCSSSGAATKAASTSTSSATSSSSSPATTATKVNANTATKAEITAALEANGVPSAARWANEIEEYRPYDTSDPTFASLKKNLAKYNPSQAVLDGILASLTL